MKIGVTLIFLLCTSFAANTKNAIQAQLISSNKIPEKKNFEKWSEPRQQVYGYTKNIKAVSVNFRNENDGNQRQKTRAQYHNHINSAEELQRSLSRSLEGSERSLQDRNNVKISSESSSGTFGSGFSSRNAKVLSREKKDKMSQVVLPLLLAYKLKFTALIPILFGGMSLLVSTTALAGFFFALFAAVLGLKVH